MQQETTHELMCVKRHDLNFLAVAVIFPPEADRHFVNREDALITDRNPMGVTTDVFDDLRGTGERALGIDHE